MKQRCVGLQRRLLPQACRDGCEQLRCRGLYQSDPLCQRFVGTVVTVTGVVSHVRCPRQRLKAVSVDAAGQQQMVGADP
jgi:hypothetical protein